MNRYYQMLQEFAETIDKKLDKLKITDIEISFPSHVNYDRNYEILIVVTLASYKAERIGFKLELSDKFYLHIGKEKVMNDIKSIFSIYIGNFNYRVHINDIITKEFVCLRSALEYINYEAKVNGFRNISLITIGNSKYGIPYE